MAITKLMHMKQSPGSNPSAHLKNAIDYILDVKHNEKKTKGGLLVGGNCGTDAGGIYKNMMETKKFHDKNWGRQGYHFVLSFPPSEVMEEQALDLTNKFCEEYLGDEYDYVTASHNDQAHKHGHIIFNSVSRSGKKYRYEKGDWERHIQRITNRICQEEGLSYIKLDDPGERARQRGQKKWEAGQGHKNWSNLIRQNIDEAIEMSEDYADFLVTMRSIGYQVREGRFRDGEEYLSIRSEGMESGRRTKYLGKGYSPDDIKYRIGHKDLEADARQAVEDLEPRKRLLKSKYRKVRGLPMVSYQYRKCCFLCTWNNRIRSPYQQAKPWKYRKDLRELDKHMERLEYTVKHGIRTVQDLQARVKAVEDRGWQLKLIQKRAYRQKEEAGASLMPEEAEILELDRQIAGEEDEAKYEELLDRQEELAGQESDWIKQGRELPPIRDINQAIRANKKEQRILGEIWQGYRIKAAVPLPEPIKRV